jgi:uncharacterized OsmC-like protein
MGLQFRGPPAEGKGDLAMTAGINGVDRQKLLGTIASIEADASIARFRFRVRNRWVNGGENRSRVDDYLGAGAETRHAQPFDLVNDEPEILLSEDRAPNPVEYVLHALAGCLTTSLVYHAAARGIAVRGVATGFEGDLDLRGFLGMSDEVRRGLQGIKAVFDIDGDLDEAAKTELVQMAQKYSPVFDIVSRGVPVECSLGTGKLQAAA